MCIYACTSIHVCTHRSNTHIYIYTYGYACTYMYSHAHAHNLQLTHARFRTSQRARCQFSMFCIRFSFPDRKHE